MLRAMASAVRHPQLHTASPSALKDPDAAVDRGVDDLRDPSKVDVSLFVAGDGQDDLVGLGVGGVQHRDRRRSFVVRDELEQLFVVLLHGRCNAERDPAFEAEQ